MGEAPRGRVHLKRGRAQPLWSGHPWVFGGAIERVEGGPPGGALVEVYDDRGQRVGAGDYNPKAPIRVRMIPGLEAGAGLDASGLRARLEASARRRGRLGLWRADNEALRLCNAEGDGLPGLLVDRFGAALVVQVTTAGMARRLPWILDALEALVAPEVILGATNRTAARMESLDSGALTGVLRGAVAGEGMRFVEEGLRLRLPHEGQKTGHYLDQREHRVTFGRQVEGLDVLDGYCYTGGFALQAARGGARSVLAVDSSASALALAEENAARNALAIEVTRDKVQRALRGLAETGRSFDAVNLDPPKLAPRRADRERALDKHARLVGDALGVLRPGGLLGLSSCSQVIEAEDLARVVGWAAGAARREATLLVAAGQPPDHPTPAAMREGRYLTFTLFEVS